MSQDIRKKVGQLMVYGFTPTTPAEVSEEIKELIKHDFVGSIILFGRNIGTPSEVLALTTELQRIAKEAGHEQPLLICVDQENGVVRRLGEGTTIFPGAMLLGATRNPGNAYKLGIATGTELKALGINWNLAPVLDVNNNPLNPVIGVRSYGEDPAHVSAFSQAAMKGMQEAGVVTTLKHFPGHGDTEVDSHLDLPTIAHDVERLFEIELLPFKEAIAAGADTIMSAHVYFPAFEKREGVPATLSKDVITGLLRNKLGYDGVITTDCMEMNAIAHTVGTAQGAIEAINAGVDLIMVSHTFSTQKGTITEILKAVECGEISQAQIDAAARRVEKLKQKYLSWDELPLMEKQPLVPQVVGSKEHQQQAEQVFRQGITIVKNKNQTLPLSTDLKHRVLVVFPTNSTLMQVEDKRYSNYALQDFLHEIHPSAQFTIVSHAPTAEEIQEVVGRAKDFDTLIVGTLSASQAKEQITLIEQLYAVNKQIVVLAMRSPYDLAYLPDIPAYVATYEFTAPALRIAVKALYGQEHVEGSLPITMPSFHDRIGNGD